MDLLARCIFALRTEEIKANRPGLRTFGPDAIAESLLRVRRHQTLQFSFGCLVLEMR